MKDLGVFKEQIRWQERGEQGEKVEQHTARLKLVLADHVEPRRPLQGV